MIEFERTKNKTTKYRIQKIDTGKIILNFIYESRTKNKENLKGKIEITQPALKKSIKYIPEIKEESIIFEGGYSFNKPENIKNTIANHEIFYFILNPSIFQLKKRYLKRHPNSKKQIENDSGWEKYKTTIFDLGLNRNEKLKTVVPNTHYQEFTDEKKTTIAKKAKELILNTKKPTIFIITGPNCAGKSTLLLNLMESLSETKL